MANSPAPPSPAGADETTRILHRITPLKDWAAPANAGWPHMKIAVLDLETTGLDPQYDDIIELSIATTDIDDQGQIIAIEGLRSGLQQPSRPIAPDISAITGITDEMVTGERIGPNAVAEHLARVDACLSFNVQFDRRHLEQLVPEVGSMPWICAAADVPWRTLGFDGRAQGYLLMQSGRFNPTAHRAADDVASLVNLLAHECSDGRTVMSHALEGANAPSWRFEASDLPYRLKNDVYRKGYRRSFHGVYHKLVREAEYAAEVEWYNDLVGRDPTIVPVDWKDRYRSDWTWTPIERKVEVASWRR